MSLDHEQQVEAACEEVSAAIDKVMSHASVDHDVERQQISIEALSRTMTYIAATLGREHLPAIEQYLVANTGQMIQDVRAIVALEQSHA